MAKLTLRTLISNSKSKHWINENSTPRIFIKWFPKTIEFRCQNWIKSDYSTQIDVIFYSDKKMSIHFYKSAFS